MTLSRGRFAVALVALYLVAFAIRAYHPISHTTHWLSRSNSFTSALLKREWGNTYQRRHPGVTTMAIAGPTIFLYESASNTPPGGVFAWAIHPAARGDGVEVAMGVFGLSLVLAGLVVANALVLGLLTRNKWLALIAGGLMAFEPHLLAQSRVLHIDALLSSLMLLSGLLLLLSLQRNQRGLFVLSGLTGGLAVLSKTPALFLVPYTALALAPYCVRHLLSEWDEQSGHWFLFFAGGVWKSVARPLLLWVGLMAAPFLLWPAMWAKPLVVLGDMYGGAVEHVLNPHKGAIVLGNAVFFEERTNPLYYPATLVFNTSFVTFTLGLLAMGHYTLWRRRVRLPTNPIVFWLLVAYAFFFLLQMTLAAKFSSGGRYTLPVYPALDILAAIGATGFVQLLRPLFEKNRQRIARALPALTTIAVVGLQAAVALPYAPYYGAHNNHLLGGNRVASRALTLIDEAEGIIYVAEYLNSQPDAEAISVAVAEGNVRKSLEQYFVGDSEDLVALIEDGAAEEVDYYLYDEGSVVRTAVKRDIDDSTLWSAYQDRPPELRVVFDGVDFLWLVSLDSAASPEQNVIVHYDGRVFVVVAWVWTALLLGTLVWTLAQKRRADVMDPVGSAALKGDPRAAPSG